MKNIFLVIISILLISCAKDYKNSLRKAWDIESHINYNDFSDSDEKLFNEVRNIFKEVAAACSDNWGMGFSQEGQLLRKAYFLGILNRKSFLIECKNLYESYKNINDEISVHVLGYGLTLYYMGNLEKANSIFNILISMEKKQNFTTKDDYQIIKIIASKMLGLDLEEETYTVYTPFFDFDDENLFNTFIGV